MGILITLFAVLLAVIALLASIAIRAPRPLALRTLAVVATTAFIPTAYVALNELLGKPKPIARTWFEPRAKTATLLGVSLDDGKAIYLWLRLDGVKEPRAYVLPWQLELAQRLQDVIEEAITTNGVVRLHDPFAHRSLQDPTQLNLNIVVPNAPPDKPPPLPAVIFDPREQRI